MQNAKDKKNILQTAALLTLAVLVLVCCALFYIRSVNASLKEEALQYLSEVSRQGANVVEQQMEGDMRMLRTIAGAIGSLEEFTVEKGLEMLKKEVRTTSFKRMGLVLKDGTAYRTDGESTMDLSEREYFQRALEGESVVSNALQDYVDSKTIYVYAAPVYNEDEILCVIYATNDASVYASTLNVRLFGGAGYSYITDRKGEILIYPEHPDSMPGLGNVFRGFDHGTELQSAQLEKMRDDMAHDRDGVIEYRRAGQRRYMSYMNIRVNDWYMVSAVSASVVSTRFGYLSGLTLFACVSVLTVMIGMCWYIVHSKNRNRHELERLAYTDPVTGGMNWNGFLRAATAALAASGDAPYAMVSFDIDKFKVLNDLFGHEEGNRTMCNVWRILGKELGPDEPFARSSADNFNFLIHYDGREEAAARISRIDAKIRQVHEGFRVQYTLEFSFGVYPIEDKTLSLSVMSDRAGIARKEVKGIHDQLIAFYDHTVRDRIVAEKNIENEMVEALVQGQFEVYLQPKYKLSNRSLEGAEALVRWNHPTKGIIQPGAFIPVFEKNGFIVSLDEFVLERVCETLRGWLLEGIEPVPVAVNISRLHLHDSCFAKRVRQIVEQYEVPCRYLQLELTENIVLDFENIDRTAELMIQMKKQGFTFAMDDFGTGYSSLNLLRSLPVDVVKLDKAFFGEKSDGGRGRSVVADVVALAKHLEMQVVAEGVETAEQVDFLTEIGCDVVQGYFFARPMPVNAFERIYWNRNFSTAGK